MRERTTWNRDEIQTRRAAEFGEPKGASSSKTADPYLMNQDHVSQQPSADDYMNGTPSSWAEDVTPENRWETEYSGGETKRNDIGMPEMRPETFNHPEKTAAYAQAVKKASLSIQVARLMLGSVDDATLEEQSLALMHVPDLDLFETYTRLAGKGQVPPEFLEQQKGKDDEDKDKGKEAAKKSEDEEQDDGKESEDQGQDQGQQKQADMNDPNYMAQGQQLTAEQVQQMIQQAMQQVQQAQQQQQACGDNTAEQQVQWQEDVQAEQQMQQQAEQQGLTAEQVQQMIQQAVQQMQGQQQEPVEAQIDFDEPVDEMGIEMQSPTMDVEDEVELGPEDAVLRELFANDESEAQAQITGETTAPKTAKTRTASTKTVGTKPNGGVSRIGGGASPQSGGDNLSGLWSSAPDVSDVFGVPGTYSGK